MAAVLEIQNLTKKYHDFTLDRVSFSVPKGAIMGFVGENGAGKTTTIKLILNEIKRDNGEIKVFGKDNIRAEREIKEDLGVVFDNSYFNGELKSKEIGNILAAIYRNWDWNLYRDYLKRFSLPADKKILEYSKGMKMKLSIASALAHHPKLLILDEATSGLDPIVRNEILDLFQEFIQDEEHSILFSSHITGDLEKIADYITFLHDGKVMLSEPKDDLIYSYGLVRCGRNEFQTVKPEEIIGFRKGAYGIEALTPDKRAFSRNHPGTVVDMPSIDDIMYLYVKGERL